MYMYIFLLLLAPLAVFANSSEPDIDRYEKRIQITFNQPVFVPKGRLGINFQSGQNYVRLENELVKSKPSCMVEAEIQANEDRFLQPTLTTRLETLYIIENSNTPIQERSTEFLKRGIETRDTYRILTPIDAGRDVRFIQCSKTGSNVFTLTELQEVFGKYATISMLKD